MSADDFDVDDYIIAGLPQDTSACDTAGNKGSWLEDCKSMIKHNGNITYVERSMVQIPFVTVEHMTQEGDEEAGAILFTLLDLSTGEIVDQWIPKKLCTNLHAGSQYIYVWDVFAQQHLSKFYGEEDETPE
tara:strand:+ start:606 stop:998 length:393 start_codon:yes stop_codon:yes gene_type:complete